MIGGVYSFRPVSTGSLPDSLLQSCSCSARPFPHNTQQMSLALSSLAAEMTDCGLKKSAHIVKSQLASVGDVMEITQTK